MELEFGQSDFCCREENCEWVQTMLMHISRKYFSRLFGIVSKYGVYPGQMPLLRLLIEQDGYSQGEIAKKLNIKPSTVAISIKRMEKSGLVTRKSDEKDQRIYRVYRTEKTQKIGRYMKQLLEENERVITRGFSEAERLLLIRFLRQIMDNMDGIQEPVLEENMEEREALAHD